MQKPPPPPPIKDQRARIEIVRHGGWIMRWYWTATPAGRVCLFEGSGFAMTRKRAIAKAQRHIDKERLRQERETQTREAIRP